MRTTEAILRFLDSLGRASDGQFYLGLFHSLPRESFAVLAVDGDVVRDAPDALALDLRYLMQLELFPTLLFGLQDASGGSRLAHATATVLERSGVPCAPLSAEQGSLAGTIREVLGSGQLPLISFDDDSAPERRFELAAALLRELKTRKLLFVRREGRLGFRREDRISVVNLSTDFDRLCEPLVLPPEQVELLRVIRHLLWQPYDHRLLAAVTSPMNLLKELFTVKGGGTLVKRGGTIDVFDRYDGLDVDRLRQLLEASFKRRLARTFFEKPILRLYLEESYRGAAIVAPTPHGPYLTKFAVDAQAQGEGLGRDLWQLLARDYTSLFWRCRPENNILPFYQKVCDGMARYPAWHVFWLGAADDTLPAILRYALSAPEDFARASASVPRQKFEGE
jgi:acetylglutamate kinase